jgi:hypothetical protein
MPQLIANYKAKSADGLSMGFLFIWLLGDVANLLGKFGREGSFYLRRVKMTNTITQGHSGQAWPQQPSAWPSTSVSQTWY